MSQGVIEEYFHLHRRKKDGVSGSDQDYCKEPASSIYGEHPCEQEVLSRRQSLANLNRASPARIDRSASPEATHPCVPMFSVELNIGVAEYRPPAPYRAPAACRSGLERIQAARPSRQSHQLPKTPLPVSRA
jgi:hypothetical protein